MPDEPAKRMAKRRWPSFFNLATFFFLSYKRNYLEIFMLPTLNPPPPPWAWVTFPAVFQLPRHSECQQPDPRSSMRHFRTFPSHGITAEDSPVSRTRRFAHETTLEDPTVSRMRRLAHETSSEALPVSRTRLFAHETTLEDPPVSRMRLFAHETTLEDTDKPFLYQSYLLATLVHQTSLSCTKNSHTVSLGLLFFLKSVLNCLFEG